MLKFSINPKIGHRLLVVSKDEKPFAKIWTYSKSHKWYVAVRERKPISFHQKKKLMALNAALEFVENLAKD